MKQALIDLRSKLRGYPRQGDPSHWDQLREEGQALVESARAVNDSGSANLAWHLTQVAGLRADFCRMFEQLRSNDFRDAWMALERVEGGISVVLRNSIMPDDFSLIQLKAAVTYWQSLYPYSVFLSPEFIVREQECSICKTAVLPTRPCGHKPGIVYAGQMCTRLLTKIEILSIALVRDPVQKYSVVLPDPDPHDYAEVSFVLDRLRGPFSRWRITKTKILYEHALFDDWPREGNCPCHSGFRYAACCALEQGIMLPHHQVEFEEQPPENLPQFVLRRRKHESGELEELSFSVP